MLHDMMFNIVFRAQCDHPVLLGEPRSNAVSIDKPRFEFFHGHCVYLLHQHHGVFCVPWRRARYD